MLIAGSPLAALLAAPARPGSVQWIGIRPQRRMPLEVVSAVRLDPRQGVEGDHYTNITNRTRQVTLIAAEQLAAIAAYLGIDRIEPQQLRRNLVVAGCNLHGLKGAMLRVGPALLDVTGDCHPCSRMEAEFGPGGYNAVRGHGGVTARIIEGGEIRIGDPVLRVLPDQSSRKADTG